MQSFLVYWSEAVVQRPEILNAIRGSLQAGDIGTMTMMDFNVYVLRTDKPSAAAAVFAQHIPRNLTWFMAEARIRAGAGDGQFASAANLLRQSA